jgi:hypothetical protein
MAEMLLQRQEVGDRLARMLFVGERVDDVQPRRRRREFLEDVLGKGPDDHAVHPALEVARHVGDRLALAEPCLGVVEEHHVAAHAQDADLEGHARAQRRLLKDQRQKLAAQRAGVSGRIGLDVGGDRQQLARMRRAPFRSSE